MRALVIALLMGAVWWALLGGWGDAVQAVAVAAVLLGAVLVALEPA